jgi:hypothetical protein
MGRMRDVTRRTVLRSAALGASGLGATGLGVAGLGVTALVLPSASAAASDGDGSLLAAGSTQNTPAPSAVALQAAGWTADGWYWIRTSTMASARLVYCDLTDDGGGWMLAAYSPSHATTGTRYPNVWLGGQGAFDRLSVDVAQLWFHDGAAQCSAVLKMASDTAGVTPSLATMQIANRVTYTNPGDLAIHAYDGDGTTDGTLAATSTLALDGTWAPIKGHGNMPNPLTINAPRDWVYSTNYWNVCSSSTSLIESGRGASFVGTAAHTHRSSSQIYGMNNVTATSNSLRTDVASYAVFIR